MRNNILKNIAVLFLGIVIIVARSLYDQGKLYSHQSPKTEEIAQKSATTLAPEQDPWEKLKEDPVLKNYKQEILKQFFSIKNLFITKEFVGVMLNDGAKKTQILKELDQKNLTLKALDYQEKETLLNRKDVENFPTIYQFGEYYIGLCLGFSPPSFSFCIQDQKNPYLETEKIGSSPRFSGTLIKKKGDETWYPLMDNKGEHANPIAIWIEKGKVFLALYIRSGAGSREWRQAVYHLRIDDKDTDMEKIGRSYYGCYYGGEYYPLESTEYLDILQKYFNKKDLEKEIWTKPEDLLIFDEDNKKYCSPFVLRSGKEGEDPQREEQILPERYSFELG